MEFCQACEQVLDRYDKVIEVRLVTGNYEAGLVTDSMYMDRSGWAHLRCPNVEVIWQDAL